jgi:hypothetical protein
MNRVIIGLVAVLTSFTVLHSGKTDGNGGHYNHSTGEYHYHHGYSAHSHYDMNGDGIVDCPYSFKDNTSYQSSTSKPKSNTSNISKSSKKKDQKISTATVAGIVLAVITLADFIADSIKRKRRK